MPELNIPDAWRFDWIDWAVIIIYFAGMIALSIYLGKGQENQEDYYVGGRDLPWWAIGLSTMATQTSAISFISIPAFVALKRGGGMKWLQYEFAVPLAMIFIMFFLIPFFRKLKLISVYEYLEMRYSAAARYFISGVFLLSRGLATAAALYAGAIVLSVCFGLPVWATIIIIGVVTLIYDTIGGMKAVVYSDVIQMGILFLGIFLCCYYALADVGGFKAALNAFPAERLVAIDTASKSQGNAVPFWAFFIGGFFLYASYYGTDQSQTQRELSAPTTDDTKKSLVFNGFFRFPLTVLYVLMGVLVGAYVFENPAFQNYIPVVDGNPNYDYMLPIFILGNIPHGVRAVIFSAILAAVMSSMDSAINSLSAASMRDFFEKLVDFGEKPKKYLFFSKATTVFWGAFVTVSAFIFGGGGKTIVESINTVGSMFYGPILAAFLVGVVYKRANTTSVITGVILGVGANIICWQYFPDVHWMWWNLIGFGVAMNAAILLSFIGKQVDHEKVEHLIIWTSDHTADEDRWMPRYALLTIYFVFMLLFAYYLPKILT